MFVLVSTSGPQCTRLLMLMCMLVSVQIRMCGIHPPDILRLLDRLDIWQIDGDGLAIAPDQHTLELLVLARVDLLVRHPRRHVDEIARAGFSDKLELLAPAHARLALEDVDDALEVAVVMRTGLGVCVDGDGAGPELLGTHTRKIDGRGAGHARCLRRVRIEAVCGDDGDAGVFPFGGGVGSHCVPVARCHHATALEYR